MWATNCPFKALKFKFLWTKWKKKINQWACYNRIWSWSPMQCEKHDPGASVTTKTSAFGLGFCLLSPSGHVFHTAWETMIKSYIIAYNVPGWLLKWLNSITAHGSVSNEPGSVTWLATKYLKTVSWRNHTEILTTLRPQNISFWAKINSIFIFHYFDAKLLGKYSQTPVWQLCEILDLIQFSKQPDLT